ncbi:MAG: hypothetical protein GF387_03260, partial [Candidatus Portnoybacteria bacterium]|nr:hypothetical protein [Candidatus Portnoybacteria bacterium]
MQLSFHKIKNSSKICSFIKFIKIFLIKTKVKALDLLKGHKSPKHESDIVICGLIRTPNLFIRSLKDFIKLRKKGVVNKIIYSTWKGEVDKYS